MTNIVKPCLNTLNHKDAWVEASGLVHRWLEKSERADELMDHVTEQLHGVERARVLHLVYGVLRHHRRLRSIMDRRFSHPPRHRVVAILLVAGFELLECLSGTKDPATIAKVVHHGVEKAKKQVSPVECKLINAVLRRMSEDMAAQEVPGILAPSHKLAEYFSHHEWLVRHWLALFGAASTRKLLEWNQTPGEVTVRWRSRNGAVVPPWMKPTPWANFYTLEQGHWQDVEELLKSGDLYVQDPSTRFAVELLGAKAGESVLDLCAAPGGKSVMIADSMGSGMLVAVDLPGQRQDRLKQNLGRVKGVESTLVEADVARDLDRNLKAKGVPQVYDAVLLDVPCSNTGVMRHRVDVKDRLDLTDIAKHAKQQLYMLESSCRHVAPGGRIVYSTCSIDPQENKGVIDAFLKVHGSSFSLVKEVQSFPWESGHDGAAAFLLKRK